MQNSQIVRNRTRASLKQKLLAEVRLFCTPDKQVWKKPILETLHDLRTANVHAVFFGGTLRSLLVSRLYQQKPGRPRDVDLVVSGSSITALKELFAGCVSRETRFG